MEIYKRSRFVQSGYQEGSRLISQVVRSCQPQQPKSGPRIVRGCTGLWESALWFCPEGVDCLGFLGLQLMEVIGTPRVLHDPAC